MKRMHQTVVKDKIKIEETIKELDLYKKEALQKTWTKVSECVLASVANIRAANG